MKEYSILWRKAGYASATRFTKNNKITCKDINKNISAVASNKPISIWVHQPNVLSSYAVLSSAIELYRYSKENNTIPVFVVLDYDEGGDQRFRAPCLPAIHPIRDFRYFLNGAVRKKDRKKIANTLTISQDVLEKWKDRYRNNLIYWSRYYNLDIDVDVVNCSDRFSVFHEKIITEASTLQILNDLESLNISGIVPIFASDIWATVYKLAIELSLRLVELKRLKQDEVVWWICPVCKERKRCSIERGSVIESKCNNCSTLYNKHIDNIVPHEVLPQHQLCNLIDITFCNPDSFVFYQKTEQHFEKTYSDISITEDINTKPRIYTYVDSFCPPTENYRQYNDRGWSKGVFSLRYILDLFSGNSVMLKNRVLNSIESHCIAGRENSCD